MRSKHAGALIRLICVALGLASPAGARAQADPVPQPSTWRAAHSAVSRSATLAWHEFARDMVGRNAPNQQAALRLFAYLALAQHRALATLPAGSEGHASGIIAGASTEILKYIFPADSAAVEAHLRRSTRHAPAREAFAAGAAAGRRVGHAVVAYARADRFDAPWHGAAPIGAQHWHSSAPPLLPGLGRMRPFFLAAGDQFRPPPPPAPGSARFDSALAEVRRISDARTPEQTAIAQRWAGSTGSLVAGFWNEQAARLIARHGLDDERAAHALALMHMAAMDANIACHDAKYAYWLPRPSQLDTAITLVLDLPSHPSYPSNHACVSGAAASILAALFPRELERLLALSREAGVSRVYAGVHYDFDAAAGYTIADSVAALTLSRGVAGVAAFVLDAH